MILTPRQQQLQRMRDEMAPGAQPAAIVPHTFAEVVTMCEALARADLAPKNLRGKVMDMAMVIMTGAEVGLPPMASLRLYTTWDGVPRLMAEGVRAIILQSPAIEYFEMATCDDNHATWIGKRRGRPEKSVTWTHERARKAGLLDKPVWKAYEQDMHNARASMQLARIIAPDVVAGMVALEEARDGDLIDAQSVEAKPVFVAPPVPGTVTVLRADAPQGPPPGVPISSAPSVAHAAAVAAGVRAVEQQSAQAVTVTPTGTQPSETPRRGPGRPPKTPPAAPSQTPGTDPFRAAREAVDQRAAEQGRTNLATEIGAVAAAMAERRFVEGVRGGPTAAEDAPPNGPTTDRFGQAIADPTSAGGPSAPPASNEASSTPSEGSSTSSTSPADDFGGSEDPEDSQPGPTGDPGLMLIADLQAFLAGCKTQTEMQNGRPPFAQRSTALFDAGDRRFKSASNSGPAGELAAQLGQLWADRKRQLPV